MERLEYFSLFHSHKRNERKKTRFEVMYHAKNIRKKQLICRKILKIITYLGMLALRPTASSSPENSNFSQKLYTSIPCPFLPSITTVCRQTKRVHCSCMPSMTRKRGHLLWNILTIDLTTTTYLLTVKMSQEF